MGDNSSHLGIVREIVLKGTTAQENFYPIVHVFLAQLQIVTSLPVEFVINYSTAMLSVLFVLFTYLLAKLVFDNYKPVILTLAAVGCVRFPSSLFAL